MDWSIRERYAWVEDKEHCEENGRMLQADPTKARRSGSLPMKSHVLVVCVIHRFVLLGPVAIVLR